eukprot:maker-scaffold190_size271632-snap-gene-0.19 protein:Tk12363 transcript:maker-scaffold190_size271632-snap-gene-0.19-mRNA-1 annotation:"a g-specific adenine dna glycosylase"
MACHRHEFASDETAQIQDRLLDWYGANQRSLPWRTTAKIEADPNVRGYAVWVSEVMLQQTQVATVVDYYQRWMTKWPTLHSLAQASLEEVNQMWSGLGYYSRGRRLHEGALKVSQALEGNMPQTTAQLAKLLPGVGRYTAAAIASIAYGQSTGLVDGNVIRVLARMRAIGADSSSQVAVEAFWKNADALVKEDRSGDFNQALMELGATVCTPKNPNCGNCPVSNQCLAWQAVKRTRDENKGRLANLMERVPDIEDIGSEPECKLCIPHYAQELGVMNYPRKGQKTKVRPETSLVCIVSKANGEYLLFQRPKTGLLANLLEFPSFKLGPDDDDNAKLDSVGVLEHLRDHVPHVVDEPQELGRVMHQFSHIKQTYLVWSCSIKGDASEIDVSLDQAKYQRHEWLSREEIATSAISTAMKKVFQLLETPPTPKKKRTRSPAEEKNQTSIRIYLGKKSKP